MKEYSVKVIHGPHRGEYFNSDKSCVTLEIDGRKYYHDWENDTKIEPCLLDCLLCELGIHEVTLRKAARDHFMDYLTDLNCEITLGELKMEIIFFSEGWEACNKVKVPEFAGIT